MYQHDAPAAGSYAAAAGHSDAAETDGGSHEEAALAKLFPASGIPFGPFLFLGPCIIQFLFLGTWIIQSFFGQLFRPFPLFLSLARWGKEKDPTIPESYRQKSFSETPCRSGRWTTRSRW